MRTNGKCNNSPPPPPNTGLSNILLSVRTQYSKRTQFKKAYLSEDLSHMSVNDMWVKFKTGFVEAVERFIPSKMTKTKYYVLKIDVTIKRLVKKLK